MKPIAATLYMSAVMALAACASIDTSPAGLVKYEAQASQLSGLPVPATPPRVVVSDQWAGESRFVKCCTCKGERLPATARIASTYQPYGRVVTLFQLADEANLIHELVADQYVQARHKTKPAAREAVAWKSEIKARGKTQC